MRSLPVTPHPLAPELSLATICSLAPRVGVVGVWLRGAWRPYTLFVRCGCRRRRLAFDADLGRLFRSASAIVVRQGAVLRAVGAEELIRARALRVVAGVPYLPALEALHRLFPDSRLDEATLDIPLRQRSAEEVLAVCARVRVPVVRTRIVYESLSNCPDG